MLDFPVPAQAATIYIQPLAPRRIASISTFKSTLAALESIIGVTLPATPRRITHEDITYLWSGPQSWLALDADATALAAATPGIAAITDQSDGLSLFRVSGPYARAILAKLVPIDLHESAFQPDAAAITLAAHIGIRIWAEDGGFVLACFRSFAAALHHALCEAATEFTPPTGRG